MLMIREKTVNVYKHVVKLPSVGGISKTAFLFIFLSVFRCHYVITWRENWQLVAFRRLT